MITQDPIRTPRPKGITQRLQQTQNREFTIKKIRRELIKEYSEGGYKYKGVIMDIPTFAEYLGMRTEELMRELSQGLESFLDKDNLKGFLGGAAMKAFFGAMEGSESSAGQLAAMMASQKGTYKPFISAAVNEAIRNKLASTKLTMEAVKMLSELYQMEMAVNTNTAHQFIGTDEALKLIRNEVPLALQNNPPALKALEANYNLINGPEIDARKQDGTEIMVPIPIDTEEPIGPNKLEKHQNRRANLLNMVDEDEVPGIEGVEGF